MSLSPSLLTANKLWDTIKEIQSNLDFSDERLSKILNLSSEQFRSKKLKGQDIPATSLFSLADELELNFEDMLHQNFDFELLRKNYFQAPNTIPLNYQRCAFSRMFTLANIFKQAEVYGKSTQLLRTIQLKRTVLDHEHESISITAVEKAINKVCRYFTTSDYDEMGTRNMMKNKDTFFGKTLQATRNYQALYEALFGELVKVIDTNFNYQIVQSTPKYLIVNWVPNPELVEELKTKNFTSDAMTYFRKSSAESTALYIGNQKAKLTNLKCMSQGDDYYQWRIDFPDASSKKYKEILH